MELVTFNPAWADSGTKLDLKGFYQGKPGDDRVVMLPLRRHNDWAKKGLRFVTLATAEDVVAVRGQLKAQGVNLDELAKSYDHNGHFKMKLFLDEQPKRDAAESEELKARLAQLEAAKPKGRKDAAA